LPAREPELAAAAVTHRPSQRARGAARGRVP